MMKIGVITLNGNYNFGNRLQNFAMIEVLKRYTDNVENIWIADRKKFIDRTTIKALPADIEENRFNKFCSFTNQYIKNINVENANDIDDKSYDYFVVGSDQIWNPTLPIFDYGNFMFLDFSKDKNKNIAYAASISVNEIPEHRKEAFKVGLDNMKAVSVRESNSKPLIEEIHERRDTEVLIDPTLLISKNQWDSISTKPEGLNEDEKYVLTCFLGEFSEEHRNEINQLAKERNWKVINLMDKNDEFYCSGPSEFLYLEKHAQLICTDSFHSCVFSVIYNVPFIIYERVTEGMCSTNARTNTLFDTFKLVNRQYNGRITKENLNCDFSKANEILKYEQEKSFTFLERALNIKS